VFFAAGLGGDEWVADVFDAPPGLSLRPRMTHSVRRRATISVEMFERCKHHDP
jgi:hypothetical protein